jgi:uncharacterized protein
MTDRLRDALSEAEIEQLAARLAANTNTDALSLEGVDGLFCALIASPAMVLPQEYLPVILGEAMDESGLLGDLASVQTIVGLLIRYWNGIVHDFEHEIVHLAFLDEPDKDGIRGRAWARGYMRGIRLAGDGWSRILQDEGEALVRYIPIVAGEVDPEWPREPLTEDKANTLLSDLLAGAARAYRYFKPDREAYARAAAPRAEPYERARPKIGRNDPCPCGSGKKYKRCCGTASLDQAVH